jgi:hypothetical protein
MLESTILDAVGNPTRLAIRGRVADLDKAPLAGVSVHAAIGGVALSSATSDERGHFTLECLKAGTY